MKKTRKLKEEGKEYPYAELDKLNLNYIPTEANFIFVFLEKKNAPDINNKLLKKGVIIRPMGPIAVRITIGLPDENRRLVRALKQVKTML
jgi:histidinol-phosphate aminotransferase